MIREVVIRTIGDLLMPFVLVFGLYVIWHGEGGAGGGFQGGVIVGSAFILHGLVHGMPSLRRVLSRRVTVALAACGVLLYAGVGVVTMALGSAFLDYDALQPDHPAAGQALGITLIEFGVGTTVAAVMLTLFDEFSGD